MDGRLFTRHQSLDTGLEHDAGVWPSGLALWLVDFVLAVVGSNPSHGQDYDSHFVRPLGKGA